MFVAPHLAAIDSLRSQPAARVAELRTGEVGADEDAADLLEAEREFDTDCEALCFLLSQRWGEPATLDLTGHLVRLAGGAELPEPERTLCGLVTELRVWTVENRWLGVGVARWGEAGPLQLLAAIGEEGRGRPADPG
ncbi:hypothetical protein [Streptomyces iconiensis]|uniref:Uncharacterized protein n=1 Tax=Streptomyces iconiensis TaxID=1384038 RepID=A0ABT7A8P8_9ACTN|nr:hypothetical protein [Streptomyces iconiensis]MDJ1137691.1 hypothetical protein [Streptomyces iconiensis]